MRSKYLVYFSFLILLTNCTQEDSGDLLTGRDLYISRCAACHGDELEGKVGPMLGRDSSAKEMPDSYWVQTINKGKGSMPAITLNDDEVQLVMEYIRSNH